MAKNLNEWFAFDGVDEAHAWALRHLRPKAPLAPQEWAALREYKEGDYGAINTSQRDPAAFAVSDPQRHHDGARHATHITAALSRVSTPVNLVVYRGFNAPVLAGGILSGAIPAFFDRGFFSTSLSKRTAWTFAKKDQPGPVHVTIRVPRLTPALYLEFAMPDHRVHSREAEMLLQRGILYVVTAAAQGAEALEVTLEAKVL